MTLKEDMDKVESDLKLLQQLTRINGVRKLAQGLLEYARVFEAVDKTALGQFQQTLFKIYGFENDEDIKVRMPAIIEESGKALVQIKNSIAEQERNFGKPAVFSDNYLKARKKYRSYEKQIEKLEYDIRTKQEFYDKKLNEPLKHSKKYKNNLHARLTDNLRIIYLYDEELDLIDFRNIITHDEMDKS